MKPTRTQIEAELCKRSYKRFIYTFWEIADNSKYIHEEYLDVMADHIQALVQGEITHNRLMINISPRSGKTMICNVLLNAWMWLREPKESVLSVSYSASLSMVDAVKTQQLLLSEKYQAFWTALYPNIKLSKKQNSKGNFQNTYKGGRVSTSINGTITGLKSDLIIIDDPMNAGDATSIVKLDEVREFWKNRIQTRLDNQKTGRILIVAQRLCMKDLCQIILEEEHEFFNWIVLPIISDGKNHCKSDLGYEDNRCEGELLIPERFPSDILEKMKKSMGDYTFSSQFLQRPFIKSGGLFKRNNILFKNEINTNNIKTKIISWDLAFSENRNCYTVGAVMCLMKDETIIIENIIRFQHSTAKREAIILEIAQKYPNATTVIESQPSSMGKDLESMQSRNLAGFKLKFIKPQTSKIERAEPIACGIETHNVFLLKDTSWNETFINEFISFPYGEYLDIVDATSQGYNFLFAKKKVSIVGVWG